MHMTSMPAEREHLPEQTWFVYVVLCHDRTHYTGITTDLARRLAEHNAGRGAKYTRSRRPVVLVYSEPALSRSAAAKREYRIKQLSTAGKKKLITAAQGENPQTAPWIEPAAGPHSGK